MTSQVGLVNFDPATDNSVAIAAAPAVVDEQLNVDEAFPSLTKLLESKAKIDPIGSEENGEGYEALARLQHLAQLPDEIVEQFQRRQFNTAFGLFPEISRAWCTIDSDIFLWDYHDRSDFCVYEGIPEVISAVALVKPKAGVFRSQVEYLLVLATPVMVRLFGIEFKAPEGGAPESLHKHGSMMNIALDTLQETPTDNILMHSIVGTPSGRIFMGGSDGSIHELIYQDDRSWDSWIRPKKCRKYNHTASRLSFLMPEMIRSVVGWSPAPIRQLLFDKTRDVLYAVTGGGKASDTTIKSAIAVYKLTASELIESSERLVYETIEKPLSVNIIERIKMPILKQENYGSVALAVITNSGHRQYYQLAENPMRLKLQKKIEFSHNTMTPDISASQSMSQWRNGSTWASQGRSTDTVVGGVCTNGLALVAARSVNGGVGGQADVLYSIQPNVVNNAVGGRGYPQSNNTLQEFQKRNEIPGSLPARIWVMAPIKSNTLTLHNELIDQHNSPPAVVIMTSAGTFLYTHSRPVDVIAKKLDRGLPVYRDFGHEDSAPIVGTEGENLVRSLMWPRNERKREAPPKKILASDRSMMIQCREAVAAAVTVASAPTGRYLPVVKDRAVSALVQFGGKPLLLSASVGRWDHGRNVVGGSGLRSIVSCRYEGLCQYLGRILRPIWKKPLVIAESGGPREKDDLSGYNVKELRQDPKVELSSNMSNADIKEIISRIERFHVELTKVLASPDLARGRGITPAQIEHWLTTDDTRDLNNNLDNWEHGRIDGLREFVELVLEVLRLWAMLCEDDSGRFNGQDRFKKFTGDLEKHYRQDLAKTTFFHLFDNMVEHTHSIGSGDTPPGLALLRQLIQKLLARVMLTSKFYEYSARLHGECPNLYDEVTRLEKLAQGSLGRVETVPANDITQRRKLLQKAENDFKNLYLRIAQEVSLASSADLSQAFWDGFGDRITPKDTILTSPGEPRTLEAVCAKLADLGYYAGVVTLALTCANIESYLATNGKITATNTNTEPEQVRSDCYKIIAQTLDRLGQVAAQETGNEAQQAQQTIIDNTLAWTDGSRNAMLDKWAHRTIFMWHIFNGFPVKQLESPFLEEFLKEYSQFHTASQRRARQQLLVDYYKYRAKFIEAAKVYFEMAQSQVLPNDDADPNPITLAERRDYLYEAVLNGQSSDPSEDVIFLQKLEDYKEIAEIQQEAQNYLKRLHGSSPSRELTTAIEELDTQLFVISDLWKHYLDPYNMHLAKLNAIVVCNHPDYSTLVPDLCQNIIKELLENELGGTFESVMKGLVAAIGPHVQRSWWFPLPEIVGQLENAQMARLKVSHSKAGAGDVILGLLEAGFQHEQLFDAYKDLIRKIGEHEKFMLLHMYAVVCQLFEHWFDSWYKTAVTRNGIAPSQIPAEINRRISEHLTEYLTNLQSKAWGGELEPQAKQWESRYRTLTQR